MKAAAVSSVLTRGVRLGTFANGMTYARVGDGPKALLWLEGGTRGLAVVMMRRLVRPFVQQGYCVWVVSPRPGLPGGYSVADMAEDYAQMIGEEFGGRVDLVVGHSTGGMIGFCLAAAHPNRFGHIVIAGAACEWSERSDTANLEFARLLVAGRKRQAGEVLVRLNRPDIRVPGLVTLLGALIARSSLAWASPQDLLVSAEAMHAFSARKVLPHIRVPVLLIGGDRDGWFAKDTFEETARLIPRCTMKLYAGRDHLGTITDSRFARDAIEFVGQDQYVSE